MDRLGGDDRFTPGFIYGLMGLKDAAQAVNYSTAHGVVAMTTPGDTSMAMLTEVEKILSGCIMSTFRTDGITTEEYYPQVFIGSD